MPVHFSVCIDAVLENVSLDDAIKVVSDCGYSAFEFWKWWEKDLDHVLRLRDQYDLQIAACCTKFISLVDPACRPTYLEGLAESITTARRLNCPTLISQVGDFLPGVPRIEQHASLVAGLQDAARLLEGTDIVLAIEPLNEQVDHPGYYLVRSDEAFAIIDEVNSPNIQVTFDLYHQQLSEGNLTATLTDQIDKIAHFHAAGCPGRNELDRGELAYPWLFSAIEEAGYQGFVGLEYWPQRPAEEGLRSVLAARGSS